MEPDNQLVEDLPQRLAAVNEFNSQILPIWIAAPSRTGKHFATWQKWTKHCQWAEHSMRFLCCRKWNYSMEPCPCEARWHNKDWEKHWIRHCKLSIFFHPAMLWRSVMFFTRELKIPRSFQKCQLTLIHWFMMLGHFQSLHKKVFFCLIFSNCALAAVKADWWTFETENIRPPASLSEDILRFCMSRSGCYRAFYVYTINSIS